MPGRGYMNGYLQVDTGKQDPMHPKGGSFSRRFVDGLGTSLPLLTLSIFLLFPDANPAQTLKPLTTRGAVQTKQKTFADIGPLAGVRITYADLVEKVAPAVVTVRSEKKAVPQSPAVTPDDKAQGQIFGGKLSRMRQSPQIERGLGSGVIIESNGTILTNNHVIEGASLVKIDLFDRRTFTARVVGTDPASDLAVLKIEAANLPILALGNSDAVRVGDVVLAIGNPLGLSQTVTSGIISAKSRQTGLSNGGFEDFLQTDASINQGNSGGALVNLNGELIGINSELLTPSGGSIGIGFAIPSNMARSVTAQLIKDGRVRRGMLGLGTQNVTSELAEDFGLKEIRGVIVNSIVAGGPADRAGLKVGDVISTFNGNAVNDGNEVRNKIAQTPPGTEVGIGYIRDGISATIKIVLGEFTPLFDDDNGALQSPGTVSDKIGLVLQQMTPQIAALIGDKNLSGGLVVTDVEAGSPGDEAGISPGDVIIEINRQAVNTIDELNMAMAKTKNGSALLLVSRSSQRYFVVVTI